MQPMMMTSAMADLNEQLALKHVDEASSQDNQPPLSRVFVVCHRTTTEEELHSLFHRFGDIQYARIVRDRQSNEPKGLGYVKFRKASQAAMAIEEMDGHLLDDRSAPLKVQIAEAKGVRKGTTRKQYSNEPEDTPARSRLFVVCPRELTETELTAEFRVFGNLEYAKVMTCRESGESKGFAYVKFSRASSAALAMETINDRGDILAGRKVKVLIADPKAKKATNDGAGLVPVPTQVGYEWHEPAMDGGLFIPTPQMYGYGYHNAAVAPTMAFSPPASPTFAAYADPYYTPAAYGAQPQTAPRLFVTCHTQVTQEILAQLFAQLPGLLYVDLKCDRDTGESKGYAYVSYVFPQSAFAALDQFNGIEFPQGYTMRVMCADTAGIAASSPPTGECYMIPTNMQYMPYGMEYEAPMSPPFSPAMPHHVRMMYGDAQLSFQLSQPVPVPTIEHVFQQVGPLEFLQFVKEDCGYVAFQSVDDAHKAKATLSEIDWAGHRVRIVLSFEQADSSVPTSMTSPTLGHHQHVPMHHQMVGVQVPQVQMQHQLHPHSPPRVQPQQPQPPQQQQQQQQEQQKDKSVQHIHFETVQPTKGSFSEKENTPQPKSSRKVLSSSTGSLPRTSLPMAVPPRACAN